VGDPVHSRRYRYNYHTPCDMAMNGNAISHIQKQAYLTQVKDKYLYTLYEVWFCVDKCLK